MQKIADFAEVFNVWKVISPKTCKNLDTSTSFTFCILGASNSDMFSCRLSMPYKWQVKTLRRHKSLLNGFLALVSQVNQLTICFFIGGSGKKAYESPKDFHFLRVYQRKMSSWIAFKIQFCFVRFGEQESIT